MKHALWVLALGAACGLGANQLWYQAHRPCSSGGLDCQLAWMKTELKLTDRQYERIRELHEASAPQLAALGAEVARLREEYAAFERERVSADRVDFVEFARFVETRRSVDRQCADSTRRLVGAASGLMTDVQRERYLQLLAPVLQHRLVSNPF